MGRLVTEVDVCNSSDRAAVSTDGNPLCGSIFKKQKKKFRELCDTMTTCKGMSSTTIFPEFH